MSATTPDAVQTLLLDGFGRIRDGVPEVVDGLSDDELLWRPDEEANHVAWLLWHLARQADDQVAGLADREPVWTEGGWNERFDLPYEAGSHGYAMSPGAVGAFTVANPRLFAEYESAVHDRAVHFVESLSEGDYDTVIDDNWDPPVTIGVRLLSVLDDAAKHLGQAEYVKGLIERRR